MFASNQAMLLSKFSIVSIVEVTRLFNHSQSYKNFNRLFSFAPDSSVSKHKIPHIRRRMIPFIKCVHPDFFAHEISSVKETNEASLQELNEVLDLCHYKILEASGIDPAMKMRSTLAENYSFSFYHFTTDSSSHSKRKRLDLFTCNLSFPKNILLQTTPQTFRRHAEKEFGKLLSAAGLEARFDKDADSTFRSTRQDEKNSRIREIFRKRQEKRLAQEKYEQIQRDHICMFTSGRTTPISHKTSGSFIGERNLKGRHVNDFLRSGRVLFKHASFEIQVRTLRRLHALFAEYYDEWLLDDTTIWDNIALVMDGQGDIYDVSTTDYGGQIFIMPIRFNDKDAVQFFSCIFENRASLKKSNLEMRINDAARRASEIDKDDWYL